MTGRPPAASDEDIINAVRAALEAVDRPFVKSSEVAEHSPIKQKGTRDRLQDLADEGRIGRYDLGNGYLWWLAEK